MAKGEAWGCPPRIRNRLDSITGLVTAPENLRLWRRAQPAANAIAI